MELSALTRLLLAVAGKNDSDILASPDIPRDAIHREATVGIAILVTAAFAFVASATSMTMILADHPWRHVVAVPFGLLWAIAIFSIDRALILSMSRSRRWLPVACRVLLGVVIATSVSVPIDIALFSERVEETLLTRRQQAELESLERVEKLHGAAAAAADAAAALVELERARAAAAMPEEITRVAEAAKECERSLQSSRDTVARTLVKLDSQEAQVRRVLDAAARRVPVDSQRVRQLSDDVKRVATRRAMAAQQLERSERRCDEMQNHARAAQEKFRVEANRQVELALESVRQANAQRSDVARKVAVDHQRTREIVEQSLGNSFVAKAEALHELVLTNRSALITYLLVATLWLTLEMAAILAKLNCQDSVIDGLLECKQRRAEAAAEHELVQLQRTLAARRERDERLFERMLALADQDTRGAAERLAAESGATNAFAGPLEALRQLQAQLAAAEAIDGRLARMDPRRQELYERIRKTIEAAAEGAVGAASAVKTGC